MNTKKDKNDYKEALESCDEENINEEISTSKPANCKVNIQGSTIRFVKNKTEAIANFNGISVSPNTCKWKFHSVATQVVPATATITSQTRVANNVTVYVDTTAPAVGDTIAVIVVFECICANGGTNYSVHEITGTK